MTRISSEDAVSTSPSPAHPLPLDDGLFFSVKRMEVDPALMWTTRSCLDDEGPFIVFTRSSFQPVVIKHTAGIGLEVQHNTFLMERGRALDCKATHVQMYPDWHSKACWGPDGVHTVHVGPYLAHIVLY